MNVLIDWLLGPLAYGSHMRLIQTKEGMVALGDTCCEGEHEAA